MSNLKIPDVFSTHSAAKYCRVTPMTIIRWIEEGRIKAYKTPGGHRRIMRGDLDEFCRATGIPIEWDTRINQGPKRVLVIDDDEQSVNSILDALLDAEGDESMVTFKIAHTDNAFDAGMMMRDLKPEIIFLDLDLTGTDPVRLIASIRHDADLRDCRVVGIASEQTPANMPVDRVLHRPLARGAVRQATGPMPIVKI
ncbi:MAG: hypothetical protein CMH52_00980 [Myxococcales bacterium]|nr:hypothetical protein [Myxococcales bacterium]